MGAMLAALPAVTVALCEDGAPMQPGDLELFSGAKQVAAQLRQLARQKRRTGGCTRSCCGGTCAIKMLRGLPP